MSPDEIKDKILNWIAEEGFEIIKVGKDEDSNFVLAVKSAGTTNPDFCINIISSKLVEGISFRFTGKFSGDDRKTFLAIQEDYREKILEEIEAGAALARVVFAYKYDEKYVEFNGIDRIFPDGITKDRFFTVFDGLTGFYQYIVYVLKKYNLRRPRVDNFGI